MQKFNLLLNKNMLNITILDSIIFFCPIMQLNKFPFQLQVYKSSNAKATKSKNPLHTCESWKWSHLQVSGVLFLSNIPLLQVKESSNCNKPVSKALLGKIYKSCHSLNLNLLEASQHTQETIRTRGGAHSPHWLLVLH